MSDWNLLQKPFRGLHWWYRILTGTHWTFPYMKQRGDNVYWKSLIKDSSVKKPCFLLNYINCVVKWKRLPRKLRWS